METNTNISLTNEPIHELLPWHMPEVKRLSVNLDTANAKGTNSDGNTSASPKSV